MKKKLILKESLFEDTALSADVMNGRTAKQVFNRLMAEIQDISPILWPHSAECTYSKKFNRIGMSMDTLRIAPVPHSAARTGGTIWMYVDNNGEEVDKSEVMKLLPKIKDTADRVVREVYPNATIKFSDGVTPSYQLLGHLTVEVKDPANMNLTDQEIANKVNRGNKDVLELDDSADASRLYVNTPENVEMLKNRFRDITWLDDGETWEESGFMDYYDPSHEFVFYSSHDGIMTSSREEILSSSVFA